MQDPRIMKLADVLVAHSTEVQAGENVLIEAFDIPDEMVIALIRRIREAGGIALVTLKHNQVQRELIRGSSSDGLKLVGDYETYRMKNVQAYMGLRGSFRSTTI